MGDTKTVVFTLAKPADDFSPLFGKNKPDVSSSKSLELLSASKK